MTEKATHEKERAQLFDAIDEFRYAMLMTNDPQGAPRGRPMAIVSVEPSGRMWFASRDQTGKVFELAKDHAAGVVMQSSSAFVSLTGEANAEHDGERVKRLWKPILEPWFPDGPEDPELTLIRFDPREAEVWKTGAREALAFMFEAARAIAKGQPIEAPETGHAHLSLP